LANMLFRAQLVVLFALGVIAGFFLAFGRDHWNAYVQYVSTAGSPRTDLTFSISGTVAFVMPAGKTVAAGDIVAELTDSAFSAELAQAQSALAVEEAKAAEITALQSRQQTLARFATARLQQAVAGDTRLLAGALNTATSSVSVAVAESDALFASASSSNPQLLVATDELSAAAAESGRVAVSASLRHLAVLTGTLNASSTPAETLAVAEGATGDLAEIQLFLESLNFLEKDSVAATSSSLVWTDDLVAAQAGVSKTIQSIFTDEGRLTADQGALTSNVGVSINQLAYEEVVEQQAVAAAKTLVASSSAALAATVLRAPVSGKIAVPLTLTALPAIGSSVTANQPIVSLITVQ